MATHAKDEFTKAWITENALEIVDNYEAGVLTLRALFYQLVSMGMTNSQRHYKRVVNAMGDARREGIIPYDQFSDRDREMVGETKYETTCVDDEVDSSMSSIEYWLDNYWKNRWENQPYYVEVLIEKKALQGVFEKPCSAHGVALGACKGYPSLTFLYEISERMKAAEDAGKRPVILYFGDYDPSGEDIPRSIRENLQNDFGVDVEIQRVALMEHQVIEWRLPPAPAKETDSRTANWDGLGQVELDAVKPEMLAALLDGAMNLYFDKDLLAELREQQAEERTEYRRKIKQCIEELLADE